jgi:hypothetical protein
MTKTFSQSVAERVMAGYEYGQIEQEALSLGYTKEQVATAYAVARSEVTQSKKRRTVTGVTLALLGVGLIIVMWPVIAIIFYAIIIQSLVSLGIDIGYRP